MCALKKGKASALILAAGYASRMGCCKLSLELAGKSVLENTIALFEGVVETVFIVEGYYQEVTTNIVREINAAKRYTMELRTVYNSEYDKGMFSSVQCGCRQIQSESCFIIPGDMPAVQKSSVELLYASEGRVVVPSNGKKGGHPIKIAKSVVDAVVDAEPSMQLRDILQTEEKHYLHVDDPGIFMDLDTKDDYSKVLNYITKNNRGESHVYQSSAK